MLLLLLWAVSAPNPEALLTAGKFDKALSAFQHEVQARPKSPEAWYGIARAYRGLGDQSYERLEKNHTKSPYTAAFLAEEAVGEEDWQSAADLYSQVIQELPTLRSMHAALAEVFVKLNMLDAADSETAKETELGRLNCTTERIQCEYTAGHMDEILDLVRNGKTPEALYWQTRAYRELAAQSIKRVERLPESPELHRVRAEIRSDENRFPEAVQEWRMYLGQRPDDRDAQLQFASALYNSGDYQAALPKLTAQSEADPRSADLQFMTGDSYLKLNQPARALPYLERAVKLDSKLADAREALALCRKQLGKQAK